MPRACEQLAVGGPQQRVHRPAVPCEATWPIEQNKQQASPQSVPSLYAGLPSIRTSGSVTGPSRAAAKSQTHSVASAPHDARRDEGESRENSTPSTDSLCAAMVAIAAPVLRVHTCTLPSAAPAPSHVCPDESERCRKGVADLEYIVVAVRLGTSHVAMTPSKDPAISFRPLSVKMQLKTPRWWGPSVRRATTRCHTARTGVMWDGIAGVCRTVVACGARMRHAVIPPHGSLGTRLPRRRVRGP